MDKDRPRSASGSPPEDAAQSDSAAQATPISPPRRGVDLPLGRLAQGPFFVLALVVLVISVLSLTREYAVPLAVAVLFWFLINALAEAIQRMPAIGPRMSLLGAQLVASAALACALVLAARGVADNLVALSEGPVAAEASVLSSLQSLVEGWGFGNWLSPEYIVASLGYERLLGLALNTARSILSDTVLVLLYVAFLLVDQRFFEVKLKALMPDERRRNATKRALARISGEVRVYIWIMTMLSAGVAFMTWALTHALGIQGAGFWGALAFALNFIPTIGSIAAVILPVCYALLTVADPIVVVELAIALAAVQFVAGEIVLPRLMGTSLNLSSFVIIFMLVAWGAIWGPAGMFLAIPITVILALVCARFDATRPVAVLLSKSGKVPEH